MCIESQKKDILIYNRFISKVLLKINSKRTDLRQKFLPLLRELLLIDVKAMILLLKHIIKAQFINDQLVDSNENLNQVLV